MIQLTLPPPPSANRYWRHYKGRTVVSAEAQEYKSLAFWSAKEAGAELITGPVAVTLRVYRPRRSGDLDNKIKVTLDALQGVCYVDDGQIVELHAYRFDDRTNPRVEVEISHG